MKKIITTLFLVTLLATCTISLYACGGTPNTGADTITVVDMVGDTVTIPKNPSKVSCVSRTTYDLLIAFGLGDKIDGAYKGTLNNPWTKLIYPKSNEQHVYGYNDSYETFITRGVDLVFAPEQYIAKDLREHGINAVCVSLYGVPQFDTYVTFFSNLVAKIWDDPAVKVKAEKWNNDVTTAIDTITAELNKQQLPKKKVFYVRGDKDKGSVGYTDTKCSFTEYAYRVLGFDYVGTNLDTNKPSEEVVLASDPDLFVCGGIYQNVNIDRLHKAPYSNLKAVKNNQVFNIPIGVTAFEQLSAMTPIFFYDQANKIYPELFHFDVPTMVKSTIKDAFGYELTDVQLNNMLSGLDAEGNSLVK